MDEQRRKIVIGGLLHDVGKVLFRADDGRNHSLSGFEFLKDEVGIQDKDILDQVHYHHSSHLKDALISDDSLAYITYIADNIAAAADRRKKEEKSPGFVKDIALESVFNILNGNKQDYAYAPKTMDAKEGINFPSADYVEFDSSFYSRVRKNLLDTLKEFSFENSFVNSLLETLEANLSFIPSSTSKQELVDISLYDHMKITAALGSAIYDYLQEKGVNNYKKTLFEEQNAFYEEKVFLLYSIDLSGIQSFIYGQYGNKNVLKNLRARSFYLEILLENVIDDLLSLLQLSRANVIYTGGGHAYLLLSNTEQTKHILTSYEEKVNQWLRGQFKTNLFAAMAWTECSAYDLENKPQGSYGALYQNLSRIMSWKKAHRYNANEIRELQLYSLDSHERECRICHRSDRLTADNICLVCDGLIKLSGMVLSRDFFTIHSAIQDHSCIEIGPDRYLSAVSKEELLEIMKDDSSYVRSYCKNQMYAGESLSTKLWVGDYCAKGTLGELIEEGQGIKRLGVLRADIDNLGQAFVSGFPKEYQTLSRASTFSRKLSIFFKLHINDILRNGATSFDGSTPVRNTAIIYSGGDDVFIVGAWKDILEFAIDLHNNLERFAQGTLTISAGFGIFPDKYPISYIASQTGELEEHSKNMNGKNAITLFDRNNRYSWDVFINKVIGEKFNLLYEFFTVSNERGKNFLYNLLDLMRNTSERINLARFAYTLARLEPDKDASDLQKKVYQKFSGKMYEWITKEEYRRQTITAIYIYTYFVRSREGDEE